MLQHPPPYTRRKTKRTRVTTVEGWCRKREALMVAALFAHHYDEAVKLAQWADAQIIADNEAPWSKVVAFGLGVKHKPSPALLDAIAQAKAERTKFTSGDTNGE